MFAFTASYSHWLALLLKYCTGKSPNCGKTLKICLSSTIQNNYLINIRGGEWSFKKSGSRKILAEFQGSRSLVFSADLRSQSLDFFHNAVSESRFLRRVRSRSLDFFGNTVSQSRVILRLHDDKVACGVR